MILKNDIGLIGDFIGTIPVMIELSKNTSLEVIIHPEIEQLFDLIPKRYNIKKSNNSHYDKAFDLISAFRFADKHNLHMIQAHYHIMGLEIPKNIPRPELEFSLKYSNDKGYYIIAPFSRSLPDNQKWPKEMWNKLIASMPNERFIIFGNSKYDDPEFIKQPNCSVCFDNKFETVCSIMKQSKGLISVVTGISHLAYALSVKNYLFVNQGMWGKNPEAIYMDKNIHDITVDEVYNLLK